MKNELYFWTKEQNVFFTSDTHFWHENIMKYCKRPFKSVDEMNQTIIDNWNRVVGPNDVVFHLGDFGFCGSQQLSEVISKLNGKIYLCVGNHDWKMLKQGSFKHFTDIQQQYYIMVNGQRIYLNHFPFLCFAGSWKGLDATWQLFGHVHSGPNDNSGLDHKRLPALFPTQYDVGVDNNNFTPISFAQVKSIITEQMMSLNMYRGTGKDEMG